MGLTPRFSPEERLKHRFYEPLVLLHVLDPFGQERISPCPSEDLDVPGLELRELRRKFLEQLAYICDYEKGGPTVTAMALEARPSGITCWVASNTEPSKSTICFLGRILNTLKKLASSHPEHRNIIEGRIVQRCIDFNRKRLKKYRKLLQRDLKRCLEILTGSAASEDRRLAGWLERFQEFNGDDTLLPGLCYFAYQERKCQFMQDLRQHIGDEPAELADPSSRRQVFLLTRHYIGRLGSHLKAAKILTTAGWKMPNLFENITIKTLPSSIPSLPPPIDQQTTLNGIVNRMIANNPRETLKYQENLAFMDTKFDILKRFLDQYQDENFKPKVHAELILLQYFHKYQLPFVDNDRFIACSKAACYCCYHYIKSHPGDFVPPACHAVRHLNWRAPDLIDETDTQEKKEQLNVMNDVIRQIRRDALQQIEQRRGPSQWHSDSTTGITSSRAQNTIAGGASDREVSFDNEALSDDAESLNGEISSDDEFQFGGRSSNSSGTPSSSERTSESSGNFRSNLGFCNSTPCDEDSDSDGGAVL